MSHHVYPQNPAVPLRDSAVTNTQQYSTMHPGHTSSGHPNATGNFAAPSRDYGSQQQSRTGGRHSVGPAYPVPPATQIQPAVNSMISGMQQMSIHATPGSKSLHPPPPGGPPSGQQYSDSQPIAPGPGGGQTLPPPLKSGQTYSSQWKSPPQAPGQYSTSGLGTQLPPPTLVSSSSSSGQLSGQSSGQMSHQFSSRQPSVEVSGHRSRQTSGQGLLPTPPTSAVQGLLPPPTSGHGILPSPPVSGHLPTSGHGILPTPPVGPGLLPPPTVQPSQFTAVSGQALGQGLLPPPTSRQPPHTSSKYLPPPPSGSQQLSHNFSGPGSIQPPPTAGQGPPTSSSQGQGSVGGSLPPPPMSGQIYRASGPGQTGVTTGRQVQRLPPPSGSTAGQGALLTHPHKSHPPHHPPQHPPLPSQTPKPQAVATDLDLKPVNVMETRNVMPQTPFTPPKASLPGGLGVFSPKPDVMCSTMNAVPTTSSLLNKMKLPLAIHIHPYKDQPLQECPVIHPNIIVRCRVCRAYINPFVVFIDSRHWRCNLCFRPNSLPEEFDYNPHTGKHGDRSQRMEIKRSSVEYIAPSEYMLRPPQPCVYYFLIDVSYNAIKSGVLALTCRCLLNSLNCLPGDARTLVGFLTYDSSLHFYNLSAANSQPQMMVVSDVDDVFLPSPDSLLVNLKESKDMVRTLLEDLPGMFAETSITDSALGAAIQVAEKLLHNIGGRVTVLQSSLPSVGPGALKLRDVTPPATKKDTLNMAPVSDFYKKLALELSSQQIAVDLFCFASQFIDLPTISCVSKVSSGQVFYYHDFHYTKESSRERFEKDFCRYLTRRIGFEAVMRVRCTEGLSLHTFHGNFFVRSTDLLSLPNTNPDHGYTINLAIDENLKDMSTVCFQAALLYTSSRGERRIRVHTLCLPVSSQLSVLYSKLNVQAIAGVLANMAVDRATSSSIGDARDALLNTVVDSTKMFRSQVASANSPSFTLPSSLAQLPLLILSLLKNPAFTLNSRISYDVRAQAMNLMKSHPLYYLMPTIYPSLYALHMLTEENVVDSDSGQQVVAAPLLQLSAENTSRYGIFLMDCGLSMYIWVSSDAPPQLISKIFGVDSFEAIPEAMSSLPLQDNESSKVVNMLIKQIRRSRQHFVSLLVIRERGPDRLLFVDRLLDGKTEDGTSYYEFLSHINRQLVK